MLLASIKIIIILFKKKLLFVDLVPFTGNDSSLTVAKSRNAVKRYYFDDYAHEIICTDRIKRWPSGPISISVPSDQSCHECEEDLDMRDHYP